MISIYSIWLISSIRSFSFHSPAAVALLRCFSLHTFISDLVVAQVDSFYGLVDQQRVGEGLQSWHEAKAKWTANSWAFHCSMVLNHLHCQLVVPHVKIVTRAHSCQILTSPSNPLYSTLFITFARWFASTFFQQFIAKSLTAIPFQWKYIQKPHTPSGKRMRFPKGRWTSKLLRLRSWQVDPPIHNTKNDLNVLAKTDSLKKKISSGPQEKGRTCENDFHLQYLIDFFYPVILLPQPRSRGPAAMLQPSHLHLRSGCRSGRLFLWSCWPATRRRGPAELARGKGQVDSKLVGFHCSCAELPASSTGSHVKVVTRAHSCQILTSPSNPLYSTLFITFARWFASTFFQQFIAKSLTAIPFQWKYIQKPHAPSGKRMRFPKGRWTSKLLRLRSLQVDPPIHNTKNDLNVLAKTDSLKTRKSPHIPKKKAELARMISICSIWSNSSIPSFSFHSPAAVALLRCFSLHTFISDLVVAQADFFYGLVDANRVGEGLQSWHEAKAKWTANSWAFHCSCAELPALSTGSSACQGCHSCPLMSDPHVTIQPTLFYTFHHICTVICFTLFPAVYRKVTHYNTFSMKIHSETTYPLRKEDEVPEGAVNLKTVET